jgi:putative acetyltransferase
LEMVAIRKEQRGDEEQVWLVNKDAFGRPMEGDIVNTLRRTCPDGVSFVAEREGNVVGHILFTPAVIESQGKEIWGMGLAPMAVLPDFQRQGIGSKLVQAGLEEMRKLRQPFVIVLGHPDYYPRFGFLRASRYGITSQYPGVPDEAFMILVLK